MIVESGFKDASAHLKGDEHFTGGEIFMDGKPVMDCYTYLASAWAIPQIEIDGIAYDCFVPRNESNGWDSDTKWPQSALNILEGKFAHGHFNSKKNKRYQMLINEAIANLTKSLSLKASKNNDTH